MTVKFLELLFDTFLRVSISGKLKVQYLYNLVSNQKSDNIVYSRTTNTIHVAAGLLLMSLKNWDREVESCRFIQPCNSFIIIAYIGIATLFFHISKSSKITVKSMFIY